MRDLILVFFAGVVGIGAAWLFPGQAESAALLQSAAEAYDGGRIVFVSYRDGNSQIYAMAPDGSNQVNLSANTYEDAAPVIGPDGRIAFISTRDGNQELYVMDADGGNQTRLTDSAGDEGFPTWSPDGGALVFQYEDADASTWQLVIVSADSGSSRAILFEDTEPLGQPDWSPAGTTIAFFRNLDDVRPKETGIWIVPAAGGKATFTELDYQFPRWSPDGSKLALVRYELGNTYGQIGVVPADGSGDVTWVSPGWAQDSHPRWSPDGRRLLFDSTYMGFRQLYVTRADGSTQGNYLNLSASGASDWLADWRPGGGAAPVAWGSYVAYQTGGVDGPARIHLYSNETGETTLVATGGGLRLSDLQADWLAYQAENDYGGYDVWVYDIRTGATERISAQSATATQNRPYLDGARVIWRQSSAAQSAVIGRFYAYDLLTETTNPLDVGDYGARYSRYVVGDGRLAFVDENDKVRLYDLETGTYTSLAQTPATVGDVSGNRLVAVEHSSNGIDLLATYVISPTSRLEIGSGIVGRPRLEDDVLLWQQGHEIHRWDLREGGADLPETLATNGMAPAIAQGRAVWLDGAGTWSPGQQDVLDYFTGWIGDGGEYTLEQGESGVQAQTAADWPANTVARFHSGTAYSALKRQGEIHYYTNIPLQPGTELNNGAQVHVPTKVAGATFMFQDGSTLRVGGGNYIIFKAIRPTEPGTIQAVLDQIVFLAEPNLLTDLKTAIEEAAIEAKKPPADIDLSRMGTHLNEIGKLSALLSDASGRRIEALKAAGGKPPSYLRHVNRVSAFTKGSTARIGQALGWVQVANSTFRLLNLHLYTDDMYKAFEEYLGSIGVPVKQSDGSIFFFPAGRDTDDYSVRIDLLYKMVLDDGRTCFYEQNWKLVKAADDSIRLESGSCAPITWSKFETAKHFVRVDGNALRRSFLAPLLTKSLKWYEALAGLVTPGEASLIYAHLTKTHKIKRVTVERGRMQGSLQIARALQEELPTLYTFPGSQVFIWSTAFDAQVDADGNGTLLTSEGMPVLTNGNVTNLDAYGVTWRDDVMALPAAPGEAALNVPTRIDDGRPRLIELFPNGASSVSRQGFHYTLAFTTPMEATSVTEHGRLRVTRDGNMVLDGALGDIPYRWNGLGTSLTLTPTAPPPAGTYTLTLTLPAEVSSLGGLGLPDSTYTTTFAVVDPVGAGGGQVTTSTGARLRVPAGALSADTPLNITASQIFSVSRGWTSADGLAYHFGPDGQTFAVPVTLTLPLASDVDGATVVRWTDDGWQALDAQPSPDGGGLSIPTTHLSTYAVFRPLGRFLFLPLLKR